MIKYLFSFFILLSSFFSSQTFEFDYSLTYQLNKLKPTKEKWGNQVVYINSTNKSYNMFSYDFSEKKTNWLKDFNMKLYYKFIVEERENLSDLYYYDYARKFREEKKSDNSYVNKVVIKEMGENIYLVEGFNKGRRPSFKIKIEVQKSEVDLLYFDLLDIPEFTVSKIFTELKKVLKDGNFAIASIESEYKDGYKFKTELLEIKKVGKKIILPNDIQMRVEKQFENYKDLNH